MAHVSHEELVAAVAEARQKVELGDRYTHYKNPDQVYEVVDLAVLEADEQVAVLYRLAGSAAPPLTWIRPLTSFLATVEHEGTQVPRFTKVA